MAHPIALTIIVLVGIIAALIRDRLRPGLVMASGAVVFYCGGLLSTKELLEGFANKGLMTVALLFLVSEGVRRSGLLEKFVGHILPKHHTSVKLTQLLSLPFVAFISAFLNNTPVVVIFAPMLKRWAEQKHLSATKFLIPLSYATILGGMCTLIGTSTNLVVDGLVTEAGYPGFSMFEIGKVGIFIAFFGLLYLILFSDRLLPEACESIDLANMGNFKGKDFQRIEVVLSARFPAIGRSVFDFDFKKKYGAFPIEISRGGKTILMRDMRKLNYREGDTVVLMADRNFMENWSDSSFFLMVSGEQETEPKMARWKRWTALGLLITMIIGATLGEKIIRLSGGVIIGAKHQVKLADIKRVKCVCNGALGTLCVYTKAKGGFFDMPDMKLPLSEVTLPLLEAVMTRNTGNGIDFSQGNGFDQKNSEYIIIRYMDSGFFVSRDGSVLEPWQEIAYRRIKAYNYDVNEHWGEKMG